MNIPEKKFKSGSISAALWAESKTVEGETLKFYSINIARIYRDGDECNRTNNFNTEDLPKVALVANEAYKYIALSSPNPQTETDQ